MLTVKDKVWLIISADLFLMEKELKMMILLMVLKWKMEMRLMSWLNKLEEAILMVAILRFIADNLLSFRLLEK